MIQDMNNSSPASGGLWSMVFWAWS